MKIVQYNGDAHVRAFTRADLESMGVQHDDISADRRVDEGRIVVSNRLADKLVDLGEFTIVGDVADEETVAEEPQQPEASTKSRKGQEDDVA